MKSKILFLLISIALLSSCYKEEKKINDGLVGKYFCKIYGVDNSPSGYHYDTTYHNVEFQEVLGYPRKLKLILPGESYPVVFIPDFSTLRFSGESRYGDYYASGKFLGNDSVTFAVGASSSCPGCGNSYTQYIGKKSQ